jgi:hypothetical protein
MRIPSTKTIAAAFPDLSTDQVREIRRLMEDSSYKGDRARDAAMTRIDRILGTHGVEALCCREWFGRYNQNIRACYCNAGDPYNQTILLDNATGAFRVLRPGDFVERVESRRPGYFD